MATLVSKPAPDFGAQAVMPDGSFKQIELSDFRGKYVVLFFYPLASKLGQERAPTIPGEYTKFRPNPSTTSRERAV